jgi:hypothetical protein
MGGQRDVVGHGVEVGEVREVVEEAGLRSGRNGG